MGRLISFVACVLLAVSLAVQPAVFAQEEGEDYTYEDEQYQVGEEESEDYTYEDEQYQVGEEESDEGLDWKEDEVLEDEDIDTDKQEEESKKY